MVVRRGEIWWADLAAPRRSEPGYRRPVLVLSDDAFNKSAIGTVLTVVISANMRLANLPGNVSIGKKASGLPKRSVVNVAQIMTVDKSLLLEKVRQISSANLTKIESGVRIALGLR